MKDNDQKLLWEAYLTTPSDLERQLLEEDFIDNLAAMSRNATPEQVRALAKKLAKVGGIVTILAVLGLGAKFGIESFTSEVEAAKKDPEVISHVTNTFPDLTQRPYQGEPGDPEREADFTEPPYEGEPGDPASGSEWSPMQQSSAIPAGNPAPETQTPTVKNLGEPMKPLVAPTGRPGLRTKAGPVLGTRQNTLGNKSSRTRPTGVGEAYIKEGEGGEWDDTPDRLATGQAEALVYFMEMLSTPEDSSIGDMQDAAQDAMTAGIERDLIEGLARLPKFELDPDEIDIILNPADHRPMR